MTDQNERNRARVRDLIYLDFERLASIYSQLAGGLLGETRSESESSSDSRNVRKYDLKVFKPEFGGISAERSAQIESRVLHHDLLVRTEEALFADDLAVDLNEKLEVTCDDPQAIRDALGSRAYVRASGWATIEDYERLLYFTDNCKELGRFIGTCGIQGDEAAQKTLADLEAAKQKANEESNRNKKTQLLARIAKLEEQVDAAIDSAVNLSGVPDYLVRGIRLFVESFLPNHISLRVYPFENCARFQLVAGLKRACFVDGDLDNVLFSYGRSPNIPLTLFGLVTSRPEPPGHPFDFNAEYEEAADNEDAALERALRGMFGALQGFEKFVRFSRWPNLTVQPLALYRMVR